MTKQQFARLLAKTSREGNFPAVVKTHEGPRCQYRTGDGRGCAIGLMIPNSEYDPDMETRTVSDLFENYSDLLEHVPEGMTLSDLTDIQYIHDGRSLDPWDHVGFMKTLRSMRCFRDVIEELV